MHGTSVKKKCVLLISYIKPAVYCMKYIVRCSCNVCYPAGCNGSVMVAITGKYGTALDSDTLECSLSSNAQRQYNCTLPYTHTILL